MEAQANRAGLELQPFFFCTLCSLPGTVWFSDFDRTWVDSKQVLWSG